jgi:hypothetical protein
VDIAVKIQKTIEVKNILRRKPKHEFVDEGNIVINQTKAVKKLAATETSTWGND